MANLRWAQSNIIEADSLLAVPALVSTLPIANLLNADRGFPARTTTLASQQLSGEFATNATLNFLVLWALNITDNATWRLRIYNGPGQTGSTLYDSTSKPVWAPGVFDGWPAKRRFIVEYFPQVTTARSWRVDVADAANPDSYMEIGELFAGQYSELEFNFNWGASMAWFDGSQPRRGGGGSFYRAAAATVPWRELALNMHNLSAVERAQWSNVSLLSDRIWVDFYPDNPDDQLSVDYAMLGHSLKPIKAPRFATLKSHASLVVGEA